MEIVTELHPDVLFEWRELVEVIGRCSRKRSSR
jgi:hypothetical protein